MPLSREIQASVQAIALVGFMGAGKTTVGQALATSLAWRFIDLDQLIASQQGESIPQIFQRCGEPEFRRIEQETLRNLLRDDKFKATVVALGGGTWMEPNNVGLLSAAQVPVIFLDAPVEELWRRCLPEHGQRPLLDNESDFRALYETRRSRYIKGTTRFETLSRSAEELAGEIALCLRLTPGSSTTGD